jgi:hypothetical protein
MDTAQSSQHKRSIKVKEFLEDFRSGASDDELMEKYQLSAAGLERFYGMLVERGILDSEETQSRLWDETPAFAQAQQDEEKPRFVCPSCLAVRDTIFEICPNCGISVREFAEYDNQDYAAAESRQAAPEQVERESTDYAWWQSDAATKDSPDSANEEHATSPIEIPLAEDGEAQSYFASADEPVNDRFFGAEDIDGSLREFGDAIDADAIDEVVPGMPLGFVDRSEGENSLKAARCPHCDQALDATVRKTYDRSGSIKALAFSVLFLVLGALGAWVVTQFDGYSVTRLVVIYFTGMTMLVGCSLLVLAIFMLFLARERVFLCYSCRRAYPRV